jgi:hypothetical protein
MPNGRRRGPTLRDDSDVFDHLRIPPIVAADVFDRDVDNKVNLLLSKVQQLEFATVLVVIIVSIVDFAEILDLHELLVFFNHGEHFVFDVTFNRLVFPQFVVYRPVRVADIRSEEWFALVDLDDLKGDSLAAH